MDIKKFRGIWDSLFEYDRIAERKIKKNIALWNSGSTLNKARAMFMYNRLRKRYHFHIESGGMSQLKYRKAWMKRTTLS